VKGFTLAEFSALTISKTTRRLHRIQLPFPFFEELRIANGRQALHGTLRIHAIASVLHVLEHSVHQFLIVRRR
jgi:hypothetical protein